VSERALRQLVGALAVVVALGVIGKLLRSGSGEIDATGAAEHALDAVDSRSLSAVRIERAGRTTLLALGGEGWTVEGFRADPEVVGRLLSAVDEMSIGELVAANPANHDRMGVSADSAITVTLTADGEEHTFLLGKSGRRFGTSYMRLPDADEVWLLEGDLRSQLERDVDAWRDRVMVSIDTAAVTRLVVEREGNAYALVRGDSVWAFDGGGAAEAGAVRGILGELSRLTATGFVAEGDSLAAAPPAATTTALSADGVVLAEITLGEGTGDRWARSSGDETLYRVTSFRADRISPARDAVTLGG
jgi:hypothetical protein